MDFLTVALICACGGIGFAGGAWFAIKRKPTDPRFVPLAKSIQEVQIDLADLRDLYERLLASHKRLRSSAGMAKLRAVEKDDLKNESEAAVLARLGLTGRRK